MSNTKTVMGQAANTQGIPLDITDVFSTYLYTGNGSTQTITNDIDLDGEGGLVWTKTRNDGGSTYYHALFDTERGANKRLRSDDSSAEANDNNDLMSFNAGGFTLGGDARTNTGNKTYASWTFRKAPKFFDVVTYTGTGLGATVNHNLGVTPSCIIIKSLNTSGADDWYTYHVSVGTSGYLMLNQTSGTTSRSNWISVSDTSFTVDALAGQGSTNYVAYLFAHNNGDGEFGPDSSDIIKCGSFSVNGSYEADVDIGFEPQWVLIKPAQDSGSWLLFDTMRGAAVNGDAAWLAPDLSQQEANTANRFWPTATGFHIGNYGIPAGNDIIYIAIRRGPLAQPESGTEVFAADDETYTTLPQFYSGWPVDFALRRLGKNTTNYTRVIDRLRGDQFLRSDATNAEGALGIDWDVMDGFSVGTGSDANDFSWMWKRAPGFFDVVAYTGDGTTARAIPHNLGVAPEMMFHKRRNSSNDWYVPDFQNSQLLILNGNYAAFDTAILANYYGSGNGSSGGAGSLVTPDASTFTVTPNANVNGSGGNYIAYLFATLAGVSKVFSVTKSSGSDASVDCGFTSGPRFVMLKRTDSTGDWYVWDTERGIVAGNDPYLLLNSTAAEVTSTDYIDPTSNGFTIVNGGLADGDYIGYAVA